MSLYAILGPQMKGDGVFAVRAPGLWNGLPEDRRRADSVNPFQSPLKTHFYGFAFNRNHVFSCKCHTAFTYSDLHLLCIFLCSFVFLLSSVLLLLLLCHRFILFLLFSLSNVWFCSCDVISSCVLPLFIQAPPAILPVLLLLHPLLICLPFRVSLFTSLFALSVKALCKLLF